MYQVHVLWCIYAGYRISLSMQFFNYILELFLFSGTFSIFISFQNLALVQLNLIEDLRN